jgi:hypothetical protein
LCAMQYKKPATPCFVITFHAHIESLFGRGKVLEERGCHPLKK